MSVTILTILGLIATAIGLFGSGLSIWSLVTRRERRYEEEYREFLNKQQRVQRDIQHAREKLHFE